MNARKLLPPVAVLVLFGGLWYAVSYLLLDPARRFLLPPPQEVWQVGFADAFNRTELLQGLLYTARVAVTGLAVAVVAGVLVAVLMSQAAWVERSLYPYAVLLQTIPILAIVPVLGFWFGFDFRSRVIVCTVFALFPIITNTLFGLKSAGREMHDLFTLHDASRTVRFRKLQLPAAVPAIFTGFRISGGLAVIGAIVGDFFFRQGDPGLGVLLDVYRQQLRSPELFAALLLASALGILVFWIFGWFGRALTRHWYQPADDRS
ncbi:nitrate ABC transporter permease [Streptosporangium violaceochromogenes]|nr:nitrate ABC transporter permease [Streptosporangium violaceochromogenes]